MNNQEWLERLGINDEFTLNRATLALGLVQQDLEKLTKAMMSSIPSKGIKYFSLGDDHE